MVSAAISRVALTSPGDERKILSRLITAAGMSSSIARRHVATPAPAIRDADDKPPQAKTAMVDTAT